MMGLPFDSATDVELLEATVRGEQQAYAAFYRRHLPSVLSFLMRLGAGRELAGDLAAEAFAAALLAAGRYRPEHETALPWLCGIARRKLADTRRRGRAEDRARRRLSVPREQLEDADLERTVELASADEALAALVEQLPPRQRAALLARVVDEDEYAEIAAGQGASEAATRQNVSRALNWLRAQKGWERP
jgi:RNA polymerase sigma factor (sigma-70 family)